MNAILISEHFRALFAADPVFAGRRCANDQDPGDIERPALIFVCETRALSQAATAFGYTLTVWIEDAAEWPETADGTPRDSATNPALVHAAAVECVREKLFGLPGHSDSEVIAGKPAPRGALFRAALQAEHIYDFRSYCSIDSQPGFETTHFRTPVALQGAGQSL